MPDHSMAHATVAAFLKRLKKRKRSPRQRHTESVDKAFEAQRGAMTKGRSIETGGFSIRRKKA